MGVSIAVKSGHLGPSSTPGNYGDSMALPLDYTMTDDARTRIRSLLKLIAFETRDCRGCGQQIWMVKLANGKTMPVSQDGVSHFADCPNAAEFRRR